MLQKIYAGIYDYFGGSHVAISVFVSNLIMIVVFWLVGGLFLLVDVTQKPKWLLQYKVQRGTNSPVDYKKLKKCLKTVLFNNLVLNTVVATYPIYLAQKWAGCSFLVEEVPSVFRILLDFIVILIIQEVVFYYSHRLFHVPWVYKRVHKKHHEWTAPIGIVAIYASPIEYLTGNLLSIEVGPILMRSHIVTFFLWYIIANVGTIIHHSGYHLPLLPSPEAHDYHHLSYNWNYGTFGILDRFHGTDKQFMDNVQSKRHISLFSLTPIWKLYPSVASSGAARPGSSNKQE